MMTFSETFDDNLVAALREPPCVDQIEFRPNVCREEKCSVLWYMTAREPAEVLDAALGPQGWTQRTVSMTKMDNGSYYSVASIILLPQNTVDGRPLYVRDGVGIGDDPKAAYSDAFKRAFFQWSEGFRILYKAPSNLKVKAKKYGKSHYIDFSEFPRLKEEYRKLVRKYFGTSPCESRWNQVGVKSEEAEYPQTLEINAWIKYFSEFDSVDAMRKAFKKLPSYYQTEPVVVNAGKAAAEKMEG